MALTSSMGVECPAQTESDKQEVAIGMPVEVTQSQSSVAVAGNSVIAAGVAAVPQVTNLIISVIVAALQGFLVQTQAVQASGGVVMGDGGVAGV